MYQSYLYRIFGLVVASQCECPELTPIHEECIPDVSIIWGEVPEHLNNTAMREKWIEAQGLDMLIRTKTALYRVENGKQITIQPEEKATPEDIRLYLLGSAMGAILHQRGILPFHGSSIVFKGKAITFSGPSGIGKSSLAATLIQRGYTMLADDVSAIAFVNGQAQVNPGMPQLKLYPDVMDSLGFDKNIDIRLTRLVEKYGHPTRDAFANNSYPSSVIYILGCHSDQNFKIISLKGVDKFHALRINTYRPYFVKAMGLELSHFELLQKLAANVEVRLLLRPDDNLQIKELADYVEELMSSDFKNE